MASFEHTERLFHQALELPPEVDRFEWLSLQCGDDRQLRDDVASLLEHHTLSQFPDFKHTRVARLPEESFGGYRPLRPLGHGGMSAVYLAERTDGRFEKYVALKVMAAHLSSGEFAARFENEIRFLSALGHPNITTLLDAGISAAGNPYLVMEYVEGEPLHTYCDRRKLSVADRLRLFTEISNAVEFAHHRLILHRDLKPANILVTEDGTPKLLDFGTAALIDTKAQTATRTRMLTPRYASPEQLRGERPGVASDVFSLGVILYEMLTGAWPFGDPASMVSELRRAAGETTPEMPAWMITEEAAGLRSLPAERLRRTVAGDLSAIVLRALENDPARRYPTVAALAGDVARYLDDRPVEARKPTAGYRFQKFMRRHWAPVTAAAVFVTGLAAAAGVAVFQARAARDEATRAEQINSFLTGMLASASQDNFDPQRFTVGQMLEQAERRLEQDPAHRSPLENAVIHLSLAQSFESLEMFDKAQAHFERAIPVFRSLGDKDDLARALIGVGDVAAAQGRYDESARAYQDALSKRAKPQTVFRAKASMATLLGFYSGRDVARGQALFAEAIALARRDDSIPRQDLADAMAQAATILLNQGKYKEAEARLLEALRVGRAANAEGVWEFAPLFRLASAREGMGDIAGARDYARQMVDVTLKNLGPEHLVTRKAEMIWAAYAVRTGEKSAAVEAVLEAMPLIEKTYPAPSADLWRMSLDAARTMRFAERYTDAERYSRTSLEAASGWKDTDLRVANSWEELGLDLQKQNKDPEAISALEHAKAGYEHAGATGFANYTGKLIKELQTRNGRRE